MFDPIDLVFDDDEAQIVHMELDSEGEFYEITSRRRRPGVVVDEDEG